MPWSTRIIEFLGLRRSLVGMLLLVMLVGLGERMGERFLPIYLMALGGGALSIGVLQALTNLLNALYSYPGGYLADRFGVKRALFAFNLLAVAGFTIVVLIPAWPAVIVGSLMFLAWSAVSLPAMMSLIATSLPGNKRTMGVTLHSLVRRVPMALGPVIGGLLIAHWGEESGVRLAFLIAIGATLLGLAIQQHTIAAPIGAAAPLRRGALNPLPLFKRMSPPLRSLLISDVLIRFCEQMPYAFVVIWCMRTIEHPVSAFEFGILTAVEMGTAVLVYLPVAHFADRLGKRPFVIVTFIFFTMFPAVLLLCHSFWPLVGAFIVRGLKEFGDPTRKALILDLCPPEQRATMFGLYYLVRDTIVSVAALLGALLWMDAPATNLLAATAFGVAGTLWFAMHGRDVTVPSERAEGKEAIWRGDDSTRSTKN